MNEWMNEFFNLKINLKRIINENHSIENKNKKMRSENGIIDPLINVIKQCDWWLN